jgi:hypothetical protein
VANCCECGDEPSGSCAMELVPNLMELIDSLRRFRDITCEYVLSVPHVNNTAGG